ncbi:MAG: hypothetical protein AAFQ47_12390 [Pseudomonadota bacterium]
MAFSKDHELHERRFGRNLSLAVVLIGLVGIVFGLTVVKVTTGQPLEGFDHVARPHMIPEEGN